MVKRRKKVSKKNRIRKGFCENRAQARKISARMSRFQNQRRTGGEVKAEKVFWGVGGAFDERQVGLMGG